MYIFEPSSSLVRGGKTNFWPADWAPQRARQGLNRGRRAARGGMSRTMGHNVGRSYLTKNQWDTPATLAPAPRPKSVLPAEPLSDDVPAGVVIDRQRQQVADLSSAVVQASLADSTYRGEEVAEDMFADLCALAAEQYGGIGDMVRIGACTPTPYALHPRAAAPRRSHRGASLFTRHARCLRAGSAR